MKTYADGHEIKTQDKSYYLVSNQRQNKFRLKPDIVATNEINNEQIIFDTKWKLRCVKGEKKL